MANRRPFRGGAWLVALIVCAAALAQTASEQSETPPAGEESQNVIVVLDDGQRLVGKLVSEDEKSITLRIGSVDTRLQRQFIERITVLRPAIERYRSMRAVIDPENIEQILLLIDWLRAEQLFDEALTEVNGVLEREPQNGRALRLRDLILEQKALRDRTRGSNDASQATSRPPLPTRRPLSINFPLITEEDVNLYKVYEIDLRNPPRVLIERETINKLVQNYGGLGMVPADPESADAFRNWKPSRQLEAMFDARARDLYGEVRVMELPESLRRFRDDVQSTWLVNSCATTACHGGLDAGSFMLFNRTPTDETAALTNLLILERYRTPSGNPLLNYQQPSQSLLLQYALAPRLATHPHPDVRGWRPVFTSKNARRYLDTIEWLELLVRPRPDIPIDYTPPRPEDFGPSDGDDGPGPTDRQEPQAR